MIVGMNEVEEKRYLRVFKYISPRYQNETTLENFRMKKETSPQGYLYQEQHDALACEVLPAVDSTRLLPVYFSSLPRRYHSSAPPQPVIIIKALC